MTYKITKYSRMRANALGVDIKLSTVKGKKLDVFKDGKKIASIGALGYMDYPTFKAKFGKKFADQKRKLYKARHEKDRHIKGSPGYYADQILW